MAVVKKKTASASSATPARRRRRSAVVKKTVRRRRPSRLSANMAMKTTLQAAAGGAIAKVLADNLASQLSFLPEGLKPYSRGLIAIAGAFVTEKFAKKPLLAAGMAGAAGAEIAGAFVTPGLSENNPMMMLPGGNSMALSDYQMALNDNGIYASNYANQFE